MSLDRRTHYYKPPQLHEPTWGESYVNWMKAKDEIRRFYKDYPRHLDR